jgi:hypothetical protein
MNGVACIVGPCERPFQSSTGAEMPDGLTGIANVGTQTVHAPSNHAPWRCLEVCRVRYADGKLLFKEDKSPWHTKC